MRRFARNGPLLAALMSTAMLACNSRQQELPTPTEQALEHTGPRRVEWPCPHLRTPRMFEADGRKAFEVQVKMDVDVDGAPNAYGPPGKPALDIPEHSLSPADSEHPGAVVGYMTEYEGGPPTVQGKDDPYPGYYVSQTDFADNSNPRMEDPRRYVDATKINYVVLGRAARNAGVKMGDFVVAYSCKTHKAAYAIVGDSGNESGEEGSLALVRALGYDFKNGIDDAVEEREIVLRFFPGSNPKEEFFKTQAGLDAAAKRLGLKCEHGSLKENSSVNFASDHGIGKRRAG